MKEKIEIFIVIFLAVFLATSFSNWQTDPKYLVDYVTSTSTEPVGDYLTRQGNAGWDLWNYTTYSDGRQYIFKK